MENDLKVWRAKRDLTKEVLVKEVEVSRQTINAIETGRYNSSLELDFKLVNLFDCKIEELFKPGWFVGLSALLLSVRDSSTDFGRPDG